MKNINYPVIIITVILLLFACHKRLDNDIPKPEMETGTYYRIENVMSGHITNLSSFSVKKYGHIWGEFTNVNLENAMDSTSFQDISSFDLEPDTGFQSYLGDLEPYKQYYINIYFVGINDERNYGIEQVIYTCE